MTLINLHGMELLPGGYGPLDDAEITVTYVNAKGAAVQVVGANLVFPGPTTYTITNGEPDRPVDLPATNGVVGALWVVRKGDYSLSQVQLRRLTSIPASGPVDFGDLPVLSPSSLSDAASTVTAWEAAAAEVARLRNQTIAARDVVLDAEAGIGADLDAAEIAASAAAGSATNAELSRIAADGFKTNAASSATSAAISATSAASSATAATQASRRSIKFVVLGDSNSETSNNMQNWHTYLGALCEGRALWGGYFATAGFTLANIRDTHLPSVLALSGYSKPGMVIIAGGTNPVDTTGFTIESQLVILKDICSQLEAAGIAPVLVAIAPRHDGANGTAQAAVNAYTRRWNAAVTGLAAQRRYKLLPFFRAMVDTATGLMKATHQTGDNIHFSQVGHAAIAQACAPVLLDGLPARSDFLLSTDELDTANLSDRPRLALGGGTSQGVGGNANVAYAWALLSTGTVEISRVATADDPNFFWQDGKNTASSVLFQKTGIPVVPGNRIAISQWLRTPEGLIDSTVTFGNSFEFRTAANASAGFAPAQSIPLAQVKADLGTGALFSYAEVVVPATAATLRFNSTISKGRIAFARPTVRDLTALGVA